MKKILLVFAFFVFIFIGISLSAKSAEAVDTIHAPRFRNNGSLSLSVWYYIKDNNQNTISYTSGASTRTFGPLSPGATFQDSPTEAGGAFNPDYALTWWTECIDPQVNGVVGATDVVNLVYYPSSTGYIDIGATTPCGEPQITSITCDTSGNLSYSWQMTGRASGIYNVGSYALFRSQSPDTDPNNNYIESISTSSSSGSKTWSGLSGGSTYYVRVSAVSPQGQYSSPAYSNVVCGSNTPPPEPTKNPVSQVCNGTNVDVTFSWGAVTGASNYRLEIWDPNGVWTSNPHEDGGTTGWAYKETTSTSTGWTFSSKSGQTWTARAFRDGLWSDINLSTIIGFTTIDCSAIADPSSLIRTPSCPSSVVQVYFSWNDNATNEDGYYVDVSTSNTWTNNNWGYKTLPADSRSFTWRDTAVSSENLTGGDAQPGVSGDQRRPAYNTTYYARVVAFNSGKQSNHVYFTSFTTPTSVDCAPPTINVIAFLDVDGDGVRDDNDSEKFNTAGNAKFNDTVATINENSSANSPATQNKTGSFTEAGLYTRTATANAFYQYQVQPASGWTISGTKYSANFSPSGGVSCSGTNPYVCSYNSGWTGTITPTTGQTVNFWLGIKPSTSTMNVRVLYDKNADGNYDSGETFNAGGNIGFSSSVAQVIETDNTGQTDKTGTLTPTGAYSVSVNAGIRKFFHVTPSSGWILTKYRSDRETRFENPFVGIVTCAANTACDYNLVGDTKWYTTTGGETFNFWLGVNTAVPSNPGAGPPGVGDCDGTTLSVVLRWTDNATFETGYFMEVYSNNTLTALVGTKTFAANVRSFTWKNPGVASEKLDNGAMPVYGVNRWWRIRAVNNSSVSAWVYPTSDGVGTTTFNNNPAQFPVSSACTPPADPTNLIVSSSCSSGIVTVNFSFTDNADNENGYILDVSTGGTSSSWASTWGGKYLNGSSGVGGTVPFVWKNTTNSNELMSFPDTDPNTTGNQYAPSFGATYRWRVVAYNIRNMESNHKYPLNTTTPTGTAFTTPTLASCSPPANLTSPTVTVTCPSGLPALQFSWTDNANNDTEYYVDINGAAWTGDSSPSPWGVKTLTGNGATTGLRTWTWSSTAPVDTGGDTDPVTAGNQLAPQTDHTYWWRVIARNNNTSPALFSLHIYPNGGTGTVDYPGTPVTPNCSPNLMVSAFSVPNGNVGASVNASVTVQNTGASATPAGFEIAIRMNGSTMSCGANQDHVTTTGILAAGASTGALTIPVTIPSAFGTLTATAMADSDCAITESPAANEDDNTRTTTYLAQGFDLSTTVVGLDREPASYKDNQTAYFKISITNNGNVASPAVNLGVWPKGGLPLDNTAYPGCLGTSSTAPTDPAGKVQTYSIAALSAGQTILLDGTVDSQYSFNVGNAPGPYTLKSYVIYNCAAGGNDAVWSNNGSDCVSPCTNISKTYSVTVDTWFSGSGGGVGSQGSISVSRTPSPGNQSNYIVAAGGTISSNVVSPKKISGYTNRFVPTIVYPYLAEKFLLDAQARGNKPCDFSVHSAGPNYCNSSATFSGTSTIPSASGTYYWFVNGDMTISAPITVANSGVAMVFIVKGDIRVNTNVNRIDGIYVAGQTFHTTTDSSNFLGSKLVINGAVYTNTSDLARILGGASCGAFCDNAVHPAIEFNFDPKYLVLLSNPDGLGTPAVGWSEVAP